MKIQPQLIWRFIKEQLDEKFRDELDEETRRNLTSGPNRIWGLARHERDKRLRGRLTDDELVGLVAQTYWYCLRRFKEEHPPNEGVVRRGTQDRFSYYFMRKLVWLMEDYRKGRSKERTPPGDTSYAGPRGDDYDSARQPRSKTPTLELMDRGLAQLEPRERAIVDARYWPPEASHEAIARRFGLADRFKAKHELNRIHKKLGKIILAQAEAAYLGGLDDLDEAA